MSTDLARELHYYRGLVNDLGRRLTRLEEERRVARIEEQRARTIIRLMSDARRVSLMGGTYRDVVDAYLAAVGSALVCDAVLMFRCDAGGTSFEPMLGWGIQDRELPPRLQLAGALPEFCHASGEVGQGDLYTLQMLLGMTNLALAFHPRTGTGVVVGRRFDSNIQEPFRIDDREIIDVTVSTFEDIRSRLTRDALLLQAKESAERANLKKSEFLSVATHELKTPLHSMMGFAELVKEFLNQKATHRLVDYLDDIISSGHHLLCIINDIVDYNRIELGNLDLERAPVDIISSVCAEIHRIKPLAEQGGIALAAVDLPPLIVIETDERRLRQILLNLLGNAIKFTEPGGTVRVTVGFADRSDEVEIRIADTGIGVDEADLGRITEPFYQSVQSRRRGIAGTGLGLSIVKRLLQMLGGGLTIESRVGQGTTVTIRLPRQASVLAPAALNEDVRGGGA